MYDICKNVNVHKPNDNLWDRHLRKKDLVNILERVPKSSGESYFHMILRKKAVDSHFLDSFKLIRLTDTCNASEIVGRLRSIFPGFIDTESNRVQTWKYQLNEFDAVMQPKRTSTGWRINPMQLYLSLKQLYYLTSNEDWLKVLMDGR